MSGGFGAGLLKGALVSVIGAMALSLATPLPPRDPGAKTQVDLDTPAGSGFNAERRDTNPVLPGDDGARIPPVSASVPKPEPAASETDTPPADTESASQPTAQGGVEMPTVEGGETGIAIETPKPESRPATPQPALGVPMPQIDNPVREIPVNRLPVIDPPVTEVTPPPPVEPSETPATKTTATPDPTPAGNATPTSATPLTPAPDPTPVRRDSALMRNRIVFDNAAAKPLLSVILIDAGDEGLGQDVLTTFTFPVTFALAPDQNAATARAKRFSHAGFEIVALPPVSGDQLGPGSDPARANPVLTRTLSALPEAIGLIDAPPGEIQTDAKLADAVISTLRESGHALLTYDVGLNATDKKARREGVKSATVFRVLDRDRESGIVIKRYLDRAALEAGKTGRIIVIGHSYPETVTALFSWALSAKSRTVALAPASAAILAR